VLASISNRVYGPVRTVVWQGTAGNRCPMPIKRDYRNVALRSHCRSAVWRPLTDEEKPNSLEAQTSTSAPGS